jgi:predicted ArsR family transcriptional regulator
VSVNTRRELRVSDVATKLDGHRAAVREHIENYEEYPLSRTRILR